MRLLILGASGGCGRWATRLAAGEGHRVTALVRPATPFDAPPGVTVERGDALDSLQLERVARDQDAVISCIGPQRTNPLNPWPPLRPPPQVWQPRLFFGRAGIPIGNCGHERGQARHEAKAVGSRRSLTVCTPGFRP